MAEWTDNAKELLKKYFERARVKFEKTGADADEVLDDLQRHIDEEILANHLQIVTKDDLEKILAKLNPTDDFLENESQMEPMEKNQPRKSEKKFTISAFVYAIIFGVALPAVTILVELITGMCADVFFNPIPTIFHLILIIIVPLGNFLVAFALFKNKTEKTAMLNVINSITIGISILYSIFFIPIMPFAMVGIMFVGIGLLPLSPAISFVVAIILRKKLRRAPAAAAKISGCWKYVAAVFLIFILLDVPRIITYSGIKLAASQKKSTQITGINLLRKYGSEDVLLRSCYPGGERVSDVTTLIYYMIVRKPEVKEIRNTYYKVTGTPYNAVPPPNFVGFRGGARINAAEFDYGIAGDEVAARIKNLYLNQSRIDTIVYPESATYYTEWIMEFKNDSWREREARAQILLPPDGVISRLTLWVDGEEREAAYAARAKVKKAYKKVVSRKRDPVLVTTYGKDRVLAQCFPVPADGGTIKIKIGITAPLTLENYTSGLLVLPRFLERNFNISDEIRHSVWLESAKELRAVAGIDDEVKSEHPRDDLYALRGELSEKELEAGYAVRASREVEPLELVTENFAGNTNEFILQKIVAKKVEPPEKIVFVIDGSRRMKKYISGISDIVRAFDEKSEIFLAADETVKINSINQLENFDFCGGRDNVPALEAAWNAAAEKNNSVILWLHATQPLEIISTEKLIQKLERRPDNPKLYDFQFGGGPNKIAKNFNGLKQIYQINTFGNATNELKKLLDIWSGKRQKFYFERLLVQNGKVKSVKKAKHIARLWAKEKISSLAGSWNKFDLDSAVELAMDYHLVTPVSGAVVLENQKQYADAGLEPVEEYTSPHVIPEPTGFLFIIIYLIFSRYKSCGRGR